MDKKIEVAKEIAKRFNGGGHAKAAGFVLADGMKDNVVSLIF